MSDNEEETTATITSTPTPGTPPPSTTLLDAIRGGRDDESHQSLLTPDEVLRIVQDHPDAIHARSSDDGWNVLHWAAQQGIPHDTIKLLIKLRPVALREKSTVDNGELLPLHVAAQHATNVEVVQLYAYSTKSFRARTTKDNRTVLHYAAMGGNLVIIAYVAAKWGRALLLPDKRGFLPLHAALEADVPLPIIRFLVQERPVTLHAKTNEQWLPRATSIEDPSSEAPADERWVIGPAPAHAEEVAGVRGGWLPIHLAAQRSGLSTLMYLGIEDPSTLCAPTSDGLLALHVAVIHGASVAKVEWLADAEPDALDVGNQDGWRPLHMATRCANLPVVQLLHNRSPIVIGTRTIDKGMLPLHVAALYATAKTNEWLLLQYSPALERTTIDGWIPLHLASHCSHVDVVEVLAGGAPSTLAKATGDQGLLALHLAAFDGSIDKVKYLTDIQPEALLTKSTDGLLPLHCSAFTDSIETVKYLAVREPKAMMERDANGYLPVHWAAFSDHSTLDSVYWLAVMCPESLQPMRRRRGARQ